MSKELLPQLNDYKPIKKRGRHILICKQFYLLIIIINFNDIWQSICVNL